MLLCHYNLPGGWPPRQRGMIDQHVMEQLCSRGNKEHCPASFDGTKANVTWSH